MFGGGGGAQWALCFVNPCVRLTPPLGSLQRLVALLQLACVLREGAPAWTPPLPHSPELERRTLDLTEGQQIVMSPVGEKFKYALFKTNT